MRSILNPLLRAIPPILFIVALLAVVESLVRFGYADRAFVPLPTAVAARTAQLVASAAVVRPLTSTVGLLASGYAIGCFVAVVLGVLMGSYRRVYNLFEPLIELIRPVPKAALLPALILFLGFGPTMKITVVAMASFFPTLVNTVQGVRAVDRVLTDMALTYGHGQMTILWRILLPASAPYILSGMRIALGISLIVVIIAEMLSGDTGLGEVIVTSQRRFFVVDSYAWLVVVAVLGVVLNAAFRLAARRTTFWVAPTSG